ncbi:sensor histidine kinase [Streptomyces syringium]|uniref:sensor histidine kinase n=1 Tax=Streptomyces syringium TaxID=76729 RepID=UPI0034570A72
MQGRFKRDGSAAAEPEPRGATDRGTPVDAPSGGEPADKPKAKKPNGPGSRIALRNWRISTRLVSLLALPVVAATTLGALRIDGSLENVDQLDHMKILTEMTGKATQLADALQEERDKSAGPLVGGNDKDDRVVAPREKTDRAIDAFREATTKVESNDTTMIGVQTTLVDITKQLDKIKNHRLQAYQETDYIAQTVNDYNALITSLLSLSQDMAQATSNSDMITSTRALATFSAAKEYASIQRAVISAALANPKGARLSANDLQYGKNALDSEDEALRRFTAIRAGDSAELLQALNGGQTEITSANTFAERALGKTEGLKSAPYTYMDWYDQDSVKLEEMSKIEQTLLSQMDQKARELRDDAQQDAILNGVLIILVLGISLVGAFVVARSMVRSLRRLQDTAQKVAQERLPELVKQLSETDPQDVDTTVESVGVHSRDEIGKVAAAFDDVHREAVRLAAEQALLRGNVNAMFTNLSRRSQGLIQRQLSLISELESREADPDQLSSLFRLDHLATRMRRNGENLLVLAGEEPGRRWTRPVPLVDVLRAAASEVEQYERIELSGVPPTEVAGRVVNDLVHLLAELLENATSFSSPQTKVKVTGHALPDGRVLVEIHDTGIGLSPEDLAAINERLASPPTVDVSVSRRMGLFVVGRLSLRHGIRIQLRPSDSGGTTALVMLPVDVAQGGKKPAPGMPGQPAMGGGNPGAGQAGLMGGGQAPRRQVPPASGPRPALPGRPGTTDKGLPTRPAAGAGAGAAAGAAAGSSGGSLFDSAPRGGGDRPTLPPRGNPADPAATPPAGDRGGRRPQLPARGAAPELPGRSAPSWGNEQSPAAPTPASGTPAPAAPVDDWPLAPDGGARRPAQDSPRGHEDVENTGRFAQPAQGARPDTTGQFPRPGTPQPGSGGPGDTSEFPRIGGGDEPRANTTGQFPRPTGAQPSAGPGDTGQFALPGSPADTSSFPQIGGVDHAQNSTTGQFERPGDTGQFAQPDGRPEAGQLPAAGPGDGRAPLFEELESNWRRGENGGNAGNAGNTAAPAQPARNGRSLPRREPQPTPTPQGDRAPKAQRTPRNPQAPKARQAPADDWRNPNDERQQRAEAVREPAAGGITSSGLPRRVPRANLVEGAAQEQEQNNPTGPAVSRAPDDVRGRLTNLRRGIQQGRQAGNGSTTGSHNIGPTYQQER